MAEQSAEVVVKIDWEGANLIAQLAALDSELNHYTAEQRNWGRAYLARCDELRAALARQEELQGHIGDRNREILLFNIDKEAAEARCAELVGALEDVVADILDYERVNNLAPNPGRKYCWDSVGRARAILDAALKPGREP